MKLELLHPADQICMVMERIYGYGMTTTSGGNLSIRDDEENIWVSPGGIDKGNLKPSDIVLVDGTGQVHSSHRPSSELPFHKAIYQARPDIRAILHAHPPALVSFSITGKIPDTGIIPNARRICGKVGFAKYAIPGSEVLAENIAEIFAGGHDTVIMENHGIVTGGRDLFETFRRFETLDFCARILIKAHSLGEPIPLHEDQLSLTKKATENLPEFSPSFHGSGERFLRKELCRFIRRAYDQMLITSTEGTFSARLENQNPGENLFLITPYDMDRKYLEPEDLVLMQNLSREKSHAVPSRSVRLHDAIYAHHPEVNAVIIAHPPNVMAFGVTKNRINTKAIPESYVFLREIPLLPFGIQYQKPEKLAEMFSENTPLVMLENDCIIVTGTSVMNCFDRLEITEYVANSILSARSLGGLTPISDIHIEEIERTFLG